MGMKDYPVQTMAIGAAETEGSFTTDHTIVWGKTHTMIVTIPNFTNAVTTTVSVQDLNDKVLYTIGGLLENTPHILTFEVPVGPNFDFVFTLSGVPGGTGGSITASLYYEANR